MALWMAVSVAEHAVPGHCPEHDPEAAAMAGMASHAMDPGHAAHHCCCLETCGCASAMVAPPPTTTALAVVPPSHVPPALPRANAAPARTDTRLPFANGPPRTA